MEWPGDVEGRSLKPRPGPPRGPSSPELGAALTFAHWLTHALNSLTKLPAVAAPHSPFQSPPLPASPPHSVPSFTPSLLPRVSGEITAGLLRAALKSRERSDSSAQPAEEVEGVGGRWGTTELLVAMTTAKP